MVNRFNIREGVICTLISIFIALSVESSSAQDNSIKEDYKQETSIEADSIQFFAFRWVDSFFDLLSTERENKFISILPKLGYSSQTGIFMGAKSLVAIYNEDGTTTTIDGSVTYHTSEMIEIKSNLFLYTPNGFNSEIYVGYVERNDEWYGVALPKSEEELPSVTLHQNNIQLKGSLLKAIGPIYAGLKVDISNYWITDPNSLLFTPDVVGYSGGLTNGLGIDIKYDTRNSTIYPDRGVYLNGSFISYHSAFGSDYNFNQLTIDGRAFISLGSKNTIAAFQTKMVYSSNEVPFFKMPIIAEESALRGISDWYRYVDKSLWYSQFELRQHIYWKISGTAWVGTGTAFHRGVSPIKGLLPVCGLGGRLQIDDKDKINIRMDLGFGPTGDKSIYFTFMEAF